MVWQKKTGKYKYVCLNCDLSIYLKPRNCLEVKHLDFYNKRRERYNKYRRLKRKECGYLWGTTREEMMKGKRRIWRQKRNLIIERLGNKCNKCGFNDIRCLQIDHILGGGKKEIGQKGWYYKRYLLSLKIDELNIKYQALCANCHAIKSWHEGRSL